MLGKLKSWFSALSLAKKVGVVAGSLAIIAVASASSNPTPVTTPQATEPKDVKSVVTEVKTETTTEAVPFETKDIDDPTLASGTVRTQTEGVDGVKTKTWEVTYTNSTETSRSLVKEEVTTQPISKVVLHGTKVARPNCDPNYTGACVPYAVSDVDCAGGSGNGPYYVSGPVYVVGTDIYGLDGRDNDGIGCEQTNRSLWGIF